MGPLLEVIELQMIEVADVMGREVQKDLMEVVYDFRHRGYTDWRDEVFAMYSLAEYRRIDMGKRPMVDYSLSREEVQEELIQRLEACYEEE